MTPQLTPPTHSLLGAGSLAAGCLAGVGSAALIVGAGSLVAPGTQPQPVVAATVAVAMLWVAAVGVLGVGLGLAGLVQRDRRRALPVLGLAANGLVLGGWLILLTFAIVQLALHA